VSFDNATYLSELEHADRNFSLAYMAKDVGAFDKDVAGHQVLLTCALLTYHLVLPSFSNSSFILVIFLIPPSEKFFSTSLLLIQ
tara:strand:- start:457 stop:708 length:252 start_codon:yes stop_codon:yes gene_type:complete